MKRDAKNLPTITGGSRHLGIFGLVLLSGLAGAYIHAQELGDSQAVLTRALDGAHDLDHTSRLAMEKKILQVLTPGQTADFLRGADPAEIVLPGGESLAGFIRRLERSLDAGLVYKPIEPCRLVDTRKTGAKLAAEETRSLRVGGAVADYSKIGGSAAGCGIPGFSGEELKTNTARVLLLQVEVFDAEGPGELLVWPAGDTVEPRLGLLAYAEVAGAIGFKSSVAVATCDEESTDPCPAGDVAVRARGAGIHVAISVLGFFENAAKLQATQEVFMDSIRIQSTADVDEVLLVGTSGSYAFLSAWHGGTQSFRDLSLNADQVGINTTAPLADLHINGGNGSVELLLVADTDNVGEGDHPRITLSQDNGLVIGQIGYFAETNNLEMTNQFGGAKLLLKENGDVCIGAGC